MIVRRPRRNGLGLSAIPIRTRGKSRWGNLVCRRKFRTGSIIGPGICRGVARGVEGRVGRLLAQPERRRIARLVSRLVVSGLIGQGRPWMGRWTS